MDTKGRARRRTSAFTLIEMIIAAGIAGIVTAAACVSVSALQKGFGFCSVASSTQTNQVRLMDSIAVDLRNSTATNFAVSNGKNTLPLTLTIPKRYGGYESVGHLAGDPGRSASRLYPTISATTGKVIISESITVTYKTSPSALGGLIVTRSAQWSDSGGTKTAERQIATFASGAAISFQNPSKSLITPKDKSISVVIEAASARTASNGSMSTKTTLIDNIFLRGQSLK